MFIERIRVAVVGGGGHVGLPLSIALAEKGINVHGIDSDKSRVRLIADGQMPFMEENAQELLSRVLGRQFTISSNYSLIRECDVVIITIGTPIDEHLNPNLAPIYECIEEIRPYLLSGQILVLRSTL